MPRRPISQNATLRDAAGPHGWTKRPRCTALIARCYRYGLGLSDDEIGRPNRGTDRRARIWQAADRALGPFTPCARLKVPLTCDRYLIDAAYRWLLASCRTPDSWTTYATGLADWVAWSLKRTLHRQADTIPRQLGDYLHALEADGLAPRTIVLRRNVLRSWFGWLEEGHVIRRLPFTREIRRLWRVDPREVVIHGGRRHALTPAEGRRLAQWALHEASPAAGFSVLLQATSGLRSAEVAHAQRADLTEPDPGVVVLRVRGKGRKQRTVALEPIAITAWQRLVAARRLSGNRGALIPRRGGGHFSPRRVQQWAEAAARALGRQGEISSHCLRATAATLLIENGADPRQVQEQLGHSDLRHTLTCYVRRRPPLTVRTGITDEEACP